eukprot:1720929-Rhodomonas_salina.1
MKVLSVALVGGTVAGAWIFKVWLERGREGESRGKLDGDEDTLLNDERVKRKIAYKQKLREKALASGDISTESCDEDAPACIAAGQTPAKSWIVMDLGQSLPDTWMDPWR